MRKAHCDGVSYTSADGGLPKQCTMLIRECMFTCEGDQHGVFSAKANAKTFTSPAQPLLAKCVSSVSNNSRFGVVDDMSNASLLPSEQTQAPKADVVKMEPGVVEGTANIGVMAPNNGVVKLEHRIAAPMTTFPTHRLSTSIGNGECRGCA